MPERSPRWMDPDEAPPGRYLCVEVPGVAPFAARHYPATGPPWLREAHQGVLIAARRPARVYGPIPEDEEAAR